MLPLRGLRVLDCSRILAGPWCAQLLGDAGADVIKVEPPAGDETRRWGPPWIRGSSGASVSSYFTCCNRNKRSVALDLSRPGGRAALHALARRADVLLHNSPPGGAAAKLGYDYAALRRLNPRLVLGSVTGFGPAGPRAREPAYDTAVAAVSGLLSITGEAGGPPVRPGVALTDIAAGQYLHGAVLAALYARAASGRGAHVATSLLEAGVANLANVAAAELAGAPPAARWGTAHASIVPYEAFIARDGARLVVAAMSDAQWRALCAAAGGDAAALGADARLASNAGRVQHRGELLARLAAVLAAEPRAHWLRRFAAAGVVAAPLNSVREALAEPQVAALRLVRAARSEALGAEVRLLAHPARYCSSAGAGGEGEGGEEEEAAAAPEPRRAPPMLGEHTREVLREEAGLGEAEVEALLASGEAVTFAPPPPPPPPPPGAL